MGALFDRFKKGFDAWEGRAAEVSSKVLGSQRVLQPAGAVLSAVMKGRARTGRALEGVWSTIGLPTRRDQERTLHLLHVMERRILDLEEQLEDAKDELISARASAERGTERARR